jgi:hypothetical protein
MVLPDPGRGCQPTKGTVWLERVFLSFTNALTKIVDWGGLKSQQTCVLGLPVVAGRECPIPRTKIQSRSSFIPLFFTPYGVNAFPTPHSPQPSESHWGYPPPAL